MNSSQSEMLWPSPLASHENALHITDTQDAYCALVATGILAAVSAGLFTASITTVGKASQDVQYVTLLLNQGNYQAHVTGTSLVVSW